MEEILKVVLSSEILSEETKAQLTEHVQTLEKNLRESIETEVRAELAEQWIQERDALAEKMGTFVSESLATELTELRDDIAKFRDLESEYEQKLIEQRVIMAEEVVAEKQRLQDALNEELDTLIDKIDEFLEIRLSEELSELAEDIQQVKNVQLGNEMFEHYAAVFMKSHLSKTGVMKQLAEAQQTIDSLTVKLEESNSSAAELLRESKMTQLLSNLSGSKREQMQILLKGVATERLEETYKQFVGRIMKEDAGVTTITESTKQTTVKTGDSVMINESQQKSAVDEDFRKELQRLAGITK